jgi:hypothetical protein
MVFASGDAVAGARAVVEAYWSSSASSFEDAYQLLSDRYRQRLRDVFGIRDAKGFARASGAPERIWRGQKYERAVVVRPGTAQVIVIAQWEQEGYEGITTFIFDLVQEKGAWRIENIVH